MAEWLNARIERRYKPVPEDINDRRLSRHWNLHLNKPVPEDINDRRLSRHLNLHLNEYACF